MPKKQKSIFQPVKEDKKIECKDDGHNIEIHNNVTITIEQKEKEDGITGCFKAMFQAMKR